jgi:hypothetical protein
MNSDQNRSSISFHCQLKQGSEPTQQTRDWVTKEENILLRIFIDCDQIYRLKSFSEHIAEKLQSLDSLGDGTAKQRLLCAFMYSRVTAATKSKKTPFLPINSSQSSKGWSTKTTSSPSAYSRSSVRRAHPGIEASFSHQKLMGLLLESFKELNKAMKLVRDRFYISGSRELDTLQALTVLEEVGAG